jgi:hypothetical protein
LNIRARLATKKLKQFDSPTTQVAVERSVDRVLDVELPPTAVVEEVECPPSAPVVFVEEAPPEAVASSLSFESFELQPNTNKPRANGSIAYANVAVFRSIQSSKTESEGAGLTRLRF